MAFLKITFMARVEDFFIMDNAVTGITDEDYRNIQDVVDSVDAFSRMTYKSVYIIDYFKKNFLYVSENPLFLCGLSASEVKKIGYKFYIDNVPQEDLERLLIINSSGFYFSKDIPAAEKRYYTLSYNFRVINTVSKKVQTINHQLTPLKMMPDGRIWLALCVASIPTKQGDDTILMFNNRSHEGWNLDLESGTWQSVPYISLTEQETQVLKYSAMGYTTQEIARLMFKSFDTVKGYRKSILEKFDTDSITEAINYAMIYRLID